MKENNKGFLYKNFIKRLLDYVVAGIALCLLSPFIGIIALLIRIKLGSPVIFAQARPGKDEKVFRLYKFRSMTNATDSDGKLLPDSLRLTKFGKLIRKTSIDELPELINILKGDMSLVGPRPLSVYYLPHYPEDLRRRHEVRPGLTGLAQVNGRNNLPWEDRFALDLEYVNKLSFEEDLKILFKTVGKVLKGADVAVRGTAKTLDYGTYQTIKEEGKPTIKKGTMTYSEIGSYFWLEERKRACGQEQTIDWLPKAADSFFTFSGRAAIEMVLKDLLGNRQVSQVWVPSYACVSMLQSFMDHDIHYRFYDVDFSDGAFTYDLKEVKSEDIVLIMSYFGLDTEKCAEVIKELHDKGVIVIEDITHSLLCETPAAKMSDYLVASLRKWLELPSGGWAAKKEGCFSHRPDQNSDRTVEDKICAMREKYAYLQGKITEKEGYLQQLSKFDNDLIHTDRKLKIDSFSFGILADTDMEAVKQRRKENALALQKGLEDLKEKGLILPKFDETKQTPLFYPVFLPHEDRESLRKHLIEQGIYCPVHWPEVCGANGDIRKRELSLICDQRYGAGDMQAICECIHAWYDK